MERAGMTKWVVEVGPGTIRGPCDVDPEMVSTALGCIDDEIALFDERPVAVASIWRAVFRSVLADRDGAAVLVCPTWWSSARIELVRDAASSVATEVVVLQRAQVLTDSEAGMPTVIEIAPEFVVVWRSGGVVRCEPRLGGPEDVAQAVAVGVGATSMVLVDAPVDVAGALALADVISMRLRTGGLVVAIVDQDRVLAGVRDAPMPWAPEFGWARRGGQKAAVLVAVAVSVGLICVGIASETDFRGSRTTPIPMTLLVEGRVAVKVPAQWAVRRVTTGPGSARVQVTAPDDATAVLVTQSAVRKGERLAETAGTLRRALDDQEAGIFSQFNPDDRRADRPAATYREDRGDRRIDWTVFVDGSIRIAVGCQIARGGEQAPRYVCDEAIRSAHAVN
jgi:type VII secretion-associated protein (TIGR03931 family)